MLSMLPWDYNLAFGTYALGMTDPITDPNVLVNYPILTPAPGEHMTKRPLYHQLMQVDAHYLRYQELFDWFLTEYVESGELSLVLWEAAELIAPYAGGGDPGGSLPAPGPKRPGPAGGALSRHPGPAGPAPWRGRGRLPSEPAGFGGSCGSGRGIRQNPITLSSTFQGSLGFQGPEKNCRERKQKQKIRCAALFTTDFCFSAPPHAGYRAAQAVSESCPRKVVVKIQPVSIVIVVI